MPNAGASWRASKTTSPRTAIARATTTTLIFLALVLRWGRNGPQMRTCHFLSFFSMTSPAMSIYYSYPPVTLQGWPGLDIGLVRGTV